MEFGEWLQKVRTEKNLDTRDFASLAGIDSSTVSRTENKVTQTTIYTAFKICEGLKISPLDLARTLTGKDFPALDDTKRSDSSSILSLHEIGNLITYFLKDNGNATQALVTDLNNLSLKMFNPRGSIKGSSRHNIFNIPVSDTDVDRLLLRTPLFQSLEMNYPISIDLNILANVYWQRGALIVSDVEMYTNKKRIKSKKPLPIGSLRTSNRIGGGSALEKTSLSHILEFDIETEQDGIIIGMYWEACRFYDTFRSFWKAEYESSPFSSRLEKMTGYAEINYGDLVNRLATVYLVIYRWKQHLKIS